MKKNFNETLTLPAGVSAQFAHSMLKIKGPKGELGRLADVSLGTKVEGATITFTVKGGTKREKKTLYTYISHIKNIIQGVQQPYVYKLKVTSSHFPITAAVTGKTFTVKNYLGEKVPRICKIPDGVKVVVAGADITVESIDKELAGRMASDLEQLCRISDKDRRVFQDGIYMTEKAGQKV